MERKMERTKTIEVHREISKKVRKARDLIREAHGLVPDTETGVADTASYELRGRELMDKAIDNINRYIGVMYELMINQHNGLEITIGRGESLENIYDPPILTLFLPFKKAKNK